MTYKKIKGYEYYIGYDGTIINKVTEHEKKPISNHTGKGYLYVDLYKNGKKKRFYVHRLVAEAFIPNPFNKPYINHKDGNPKNNCANNLEWCTPQENVEHASKILGVMKQYEKANEQRKRAVYMLEKGTGKIIGMFNSIRDAQKVTNIPSSNIVACLKGRQKYTNKYCWCYVEEI